MRWSFRRPDAPERRQVIDRLLALPTLPEADRMKTKPMTKAKPKTFEAWMQRHGTRRIS